MKALTICLLALLSIGAFAQSSARFTIARSVISGGGTTFSSSARFQLGSTIAQPLAAVPASSRFSIQSGFWIWPAPIIASPALVGTNFVFSFQSDLGRNYIVKSANSLSATNWQTISTFPGNGGVVSVSNSAAGASQQFFQLIEH